MIEEIVIRDLGVIGEARLQIGPGFTALTGETGAGKTMILTALGLLLGDRADSASVRRGQESAQVHGLWKLDPTSSVSQQVGERLSQADVEYEPSELIVSRTVSADGKSRASINARPVPAGLLTELGEKLVVVHGQSEQMRLKSPTAQREALDAFAGKPLALALANYEVNYTQWKASQERLSELQAQATSRNREAQELRAELAELDQADPQPGEDEELAAIAERLNNSEAIRVAAAAAHEALSSESVGDVQDVLGLLSQARKSLESGSQFDSRMEPIAAQLKELGIQAREAAGQIASLLASLEVDGERSLDEVQARRSVLIGLMRRFGPTLAEVIAYREKASLRLLDLDSSEDQVTELQSKVQQMHTSLVEEAQHITKLRSDAAISLGEQVTEELNALAMPGSTLVVEITPAELGPHGGDNIAILLSSYQGAEPRPLGKGASGGELSRIMLAIEVVLAKTKNNPTFIFDEVDAGVGGAAAIEIGKRLARLAQQAQVIVVTHLAQVAAFSNTHLRVLKTHADEFTASDVVNLTEVARVEELARMLSGMSDSELARAHAAELWQLAKQQWPHA